MTLRSWDRKIIYFCRKIADPFARIVLFVIFFYFGLLKVIGFSPASTLVQELLEKLIPFMSFNLFFILFGLFEMLIGVLFIIKGYERIVILLLFIHMIATLLPLILLPKTIWIYFMVPTLEGQYIIKNLALIALAIGITSHLHVAKRLKEML